MAREYAAPASELRDVDGLAGLRALGHRVRELHVADAVLEVRVRHLLPAAHGIDELLLHAPAHPLLGRNGDLAQFRVAPPASRQPLGIRLDAESALAAEDPRLGRGREPGDGAEA